MHNPIADYDVLQPDEFEGEFAADHQEFLERQALVARIKASSRSPTRNEAERLSTRELFECLAVREGVKLDDVLNLGIEPAPEGAVDDDYHDFWCESHDENHPLQVCSPSSPSRIIPIHACANSYALSSYLSTVAGIQYVARADVHYRSGVQSSARFLELVKARIAKDTYARGRGNTNLVAKALRAARLPDIGAPFRLSYSEIEELTGVNRGNLTASIVPRLIKWGLLKIHKPGVCGDGKPTGIATWWEWTGERRAEG